MFAAIVCAALGALGGAAARRWSLGALFPGACLALAWWLSVAGANPGGGRNSDWWAVGGAFPLTFLLCRVCKQGLGKQIDVPLDARLGWAQALSFLARGGWEAGVGSLTLLGFTLAIGLLFVVRRRIQKPIRG